MHELSKSELLVMKSLWELGDGKSRPEIETYVNMHFQKDWKPTTISTFLTRLKEKGYVELRRTERNWLYYIQISEKDYQENQMKELLEFWGKEQVGNTLAALFREQGKEKEDAERLRELVNELDF